MDPHHVQPLPAPPGANYPTRLDASGNDVQLDASGNTVPVGRLERIVQLDASGNTIQLDASGNTIQVAPTPVALRESGQSLKPNTQ